MMKIDMHFHTKMSDWAKTNNEVIKLAKEKWLDFACVTEHDIINTDFAFSSKINWINSMQWVEISACDDEVFQNSLHITCYANKFSGEIFDLLENIRNWRNKKLSRQIEVLVSNWFDISYDYFIKHYKDLWINTDNLNSYHVEDYIFKSEE